jgi:hypothetical protein
VAQVIDEMHRKLGMAREQVDLAQARKEELWEKGALNCRKFRSWPSAHVLFASNHCSSWLRAPLRRHSALFHLHCICLLKPGYWWLQPSGTASRRTRRPTPTSCMRTMTTTWLLEVRCGACACDVTSKLCLRWGSAASLQTC